MRENFLTLQENFKEMRGERLFFYLTAAFISGNLLTSYFLSISSKWEIFLLCSLDLLLIIILSLLFLFNKCRFGIAYLTVFFILGSLFIAQDAALNRSDARMKLSNSSLIIKIRGNFESKLEKVIPPTERDTYSILKALSLGDKSDIPRELKESFKKSGVMHLLSLSGLHVGIIYGLLSFIFSFIGNSKKGKIARGAIVIPFLWFYAVFTGASPSICRAVIMATVYETGNIAQRENNGFNSLAISALIITLINPYAPSSISFQLSFCAMLGIFSFFPVLNKTIKEFTSSKIIIKIWDIAALTISCQIFTAPLTLYYFDSFSLYSLLANTFSMPLTGVIMSLIPLSLISIKIPFLGDFFSAILNYMISLLNYIIEIISMIQ